LISDLTHFLKKAAKALTNLCWSTSLTETDFIWKDTRKEKIPLTTCQLLGKVTCRAMLVKNCQKIMKMTPHAKLFKTINYRYRC
jgi:two-component SAPR family response regulator